MTPQEFAAKIKAKYPAYAKMDDAELVAKVIKKYPQYQKQLDPPRAPNAPPINPDFQKNLDASAPFADASRYEGGVGKLAMGAVNQAGDIAGGLLKEAIPQDLSAMELSKMVPGMHQMLNLPNQYESMVDKGSENAQHFMDQDNPPNAAPGRKQILAGLSAIPGLGDTIVNADKGINEGDLDAAGRASFDVGMAAAPQIGEGAGALTNAAKGVGREAKVGLGRAIRPAPRIPTTLPDAPHTLIGESIGAVGGSMVGRPGTGMAVGREVATKAPGAINRFRTHLADKLDPAGSEFSGYERIRNANQPGPISPKRVEPVDDAGLMFEDDPANPGGPRRRVEPLPEESYEPLERQIRTKATDKPADPWNDLPYEKVAEPTKTGFTDWTKAVDETGKPVTGASGGNVGSPRDIPRPAIMDKLDQDYNYIDRATPDELADLADYENMKRGGPEDYNMYKPSPEDLAKDETMMQDWERQADDLYKRKNPDGPKSRLRQILRF